MTYYKKTEYNFLGFQKSLRKNKMYDSLIINKKTGKIKKISFGDKTMQNFRDVTGLNLYPHLIHGDKKRRALFHARHKGFIKEGYYSPSFFSYYFLW